MDFTLGKYRNLLSFLKDNYDIYTVEEYLIEKPSNDFVILRHDVDRSPKNALKMAELESKLGVRSTYYFRYPYTFKPEIIKRIKELEHEVGYHYETLSQAKGDYERALKLFKQALKEFEKIAEVKTVCMHGSPLSKYDNRDLWKKYDFREFGILGEAYLSINDPEIVYLTDTGRNWNGKNNLRDKYGGWRALNAEVSGTDHLIQALSRERSKKLYITTHPERWGYNVFNWTVGYLRDVVFNIGKRVIKVIR